MAARGKSINLFLMDGDPSGRIKCTLANWTGVAYKIPRTELEKCKGRDDLSQSGVYFLFGTSDQTGESVVYIGQAGVRKNGEGILYRLQEHKRNPDKDYWTEAVVFTTSNNSFGPTEISYLENRFTNLAADAKRYEIKNNNEPNSGGKPTEEKESELEEFLDYAKIVMGTLGHKVFEQRVKQSIKGLETEKSPSESQTLYLERKIKDLDITIKATGMQTPEGFIVFSGSSISPSDDHTITENLKSIRKKAKKDNDILQEDVLFKSPSYAAMFVIGKSANGMTSWKNANGKTLKDIENSEASVELSGENS